MTRDQLAEALYQKGLAMARIENLKAKDPYIYIFDLSYFIVNC